MLFREMNASQMAAIKQHKRKLVERIAKSLDHFLNELKLADVVKETEVQSNRANNDVGTAINMLELVQHKGNGWTAIITFLTENGGEELAELLLGDAQE